jgi:hypothetical protein
MTTIFALPADLANAINHNCECEYAKDTGALVRRCSLHEAIIRDDRFANHMRFARSLQNRWWAEEFSEGREGE